ncbi:MAG: PspC domain-containing protein [Bacteroidetes bacterium]|nr:PspC domain-containing protein [Bacteroidota bacterium]
MKKIININFHGRVVPIEESAYDILKQYVDSLRKYFANEEGRDEIINDIENRFAELFSEKLKKDANCITDDDVNSIITSMGRPADFEAADADSGIGSSTEEKKQSEGSEQSQKIYTSTIPTSRGRLYRNEDDKILGGVCSGLANYLGIDPVIIRIIFVFLFAPLIWVYVLLWIIVPSKSMASNITKRLFRSSDDRVIGGVAGGLAAYFNIQVWIPRLIFALPFILGIASGLFHMTFWNWDWDWDFGPRFISGGLGGTLIFAYIILWIVVPVATTASEKLEMRGERVDLNSIASTIKEDLEGFKGRAEKMGKDFKENAQKFGEEIKTTAQAKSQAFAYEMGQRRRGGGYGLGHVIGVLFKAFFLFIAGIVAISLFIALIAILFGGMAVMPFKNFIFDGVGQNMLAWTSLVLVMGIPILALITWLIRRIMGARSRNHYLGYVFASLWIIGIVSFFFLVSSFTRNFRAKDFVEENVEIIQPKSGKFYVDEMNGLSVRHYYSRHWGMNWDNDWPLYGDNFDSLLLNTVKLKIVQSKDTAFHVHRIKLSRGYTTAQARELANKISFDVTQQDSLLLLPRGFGVGQHEKFRNQQVLLIVEVPVGKKIEMSNDINNYSWFNFHMRGPHGFGYVNDDDEFDDWSDSYSWRAGIEYIMTKNGLKRTDNRSDEDNNDDNEEFNNKPTPPASPAGNEKGYRYKGYADSTKIKNSKEPVKKIDNGSPQKPIASIDNTDQESSDEKTPIVTYFLSKIFQ